jgi:hypothetical protein
VTCTGTGSCRNVDCAASCACDVTCDLGSSCAGLTCTSPVCEVVPNGCTSHEMDCSTCP